MNNKPVILLVVIISLNISIFELNWTKSFPPRLVYQSDWHHGTGGVTQTSALHHGRTEGGEKLQLKQERFGWKLWRDHGNIYQNMWIENELSSVWMWSFNLDLDFNLLHNNSKQRRIILFLPATKIIPF